MNYNSSSISIKTKTFILVLGLFLLQSLVFICFSYRGIKNIENARRYEVSTQIHNSVKKIVENVNYFYVNRGYANLNSKGVSQALEQGNSEILRDLSINRWQVLQKENEFLLI